MRAWILNAAALVALALPSPVTAEGSAVVGTVRYTGPARTPTPMPVKHDGHACGKSQPDESLLVDGQGRVRNAVVSLEGVKDAPAPVPGTADLDQKGCRFEPHVQAVAAGSTLVIHNSDGVFHNVHGFHEGTTLFNLAMPRPKMQIKRKLAKPGANFFRCDAGHGWMSAHVWTFSHPYFAVTDEQGRFTLKDVPPGTYTLRVWHEGWKRREAGSVVTVPVVVEWPLTVEGGKQAELTVELK